MLTSTLVSPNAIKLLLPNSSSKTMATQNVTVYINKARNFYVEDRKVEPANLENVIYSLVRNDSEASIVLRSDKTAPVQDIVVVIDAVNNINNKNGSKHKVILATKPKK